MASLLASKAQSDASVFIAIEIPLSLRKQFASKPATLANQRPATTKKVSSVNSEPTDTYDDLPDPDHELDRLRSHHGTRTSSITNTAQSVPGLLPTPASTPSKPDRHASNFVLSVPTIPTRSLRSTQSTEFTPIATPGHTCKRKHIYTEDFEDEDITFDEIRDNQIRTKVERMHKILPTRSIAACKAALVKKKGNFDDAMDYLACLDEAITTPSKRSRNKKPTNKLASQKPEDIRARGIASALRMPPSVILQSTTASDNTPRNRLEISSFEAKRLRESIMKQVDWKQAAEDVACNRRSGVYKRAVRDVLDRLMKEAVAREESMN
ncbi:MAG: hypothetical protein Q9225_007611 [Loekoesia sp. 1 TL-2023]